jgi:hypothetical protein
VLYDLDREASVWENKKKGFQLSTPRGEIENPVFKSAKELEFGIYLPSASWINAWIIIARVS